MADILLNYTAAQINESVGSRHTHANKATLDKFGEGSGQPTYNGQPIIGQPGIDGQDATVNGYSTIDIVAGTNIGIDQSVPGQLKISASGGGGGGVPEAPTDGEIYGRKSASWVKAATPTDISTAVATHNVSGTAHSDIRTALDGKSTPTTVAADISAHNTSNAAHGDIRTALAAKAAVSTSDAIILDAGEWTGGDPYVQTVTVTTVAENGFIAAAQTATASEVDALRNALVRITGQTATSISFAADGELPSVDIPLTLVNVG